MLNSNAPREVLRRVLVCIFALACFGGAWAQSDTQSPDLQEASKLLKAGQRDQALERVNKALAANPRDAQARFMKGLIYTEQGSVPMQGIIRWVRPHHKGDIWDVGIRITSPAHRQHFRALESINA